MINPIPHSRPWIEEEDLRHVTEVLQSGMIANGELVKNFEEVISAELTTSDALACNSGSAALILALKVLNIGKDDEVILPTYVCWSVLSCITSTGAKPRFCDVDESGVITSKTVRAVIGPFTKAIVAIHTFGHPCDISALITFGIPVIEDACQAFGLEINSVPAGTLGTFGIFSFHATKCLTTGEGGMLVSKNLDLIQDARELAISAKRNNATGFTSMSDLQAALGLAQFKRYTNFLTRRREIFDSYHSAMNNLTKATLGYSGYPEFLFRYTLCAQQGFEFAQSALLERGVQARRGVDELLHRRFDLNDDDFPNAVDIFKKTISLPFYPSLNHSEQNQVVRAIDEVFNGS